MWGAAMDLGGWLRNLGLDEYAAAFRENGISWLRVSLRTTTISPFASTA